MSIAEKWSANRAIKKAEEETNRLREESERKAKEAVEKLAEEARIARRVLEFTQECARAVEKSAESGEDAARLDIPGFSYKYDSRQPYKYDRPVYDGCIEAAENYADSIGVSVARDSREERTYVPDGEDYRIVRYKVPAVVFRPKVDK